MHETQRIPDGLARPDVFTDAFRKKPVALLLGYVGTGFRGNTVNHELPRGSTVDDVLEDAIFAAGGIKLSNYRSRALSRLKWSRSSRTDKGVSSLATVVSLRMEVDPAAWDEDVEGAAIVQSVNAHLPPNVRVFGAYSTPKSFQARRVCVQRTYDYLLPARVLGLAGTEWPGTDAAAGRSDEQILETFREALRAFVGSRYFHNYTRRSCYSPSNEKAEWTKRGRKNRRRDESAAVDDDDHLETADDDDDVVGVVEDATDVTDERAGYVGADYVGSRQNGCYWLLERDEDDLVGIKHNRKVNAFDAGDVETTPDGEPFVRVTVRGDSFMLYQIRKMIATACAATLGHFPLGMIPASLARPARVATPLAPASTLYLRGAEFMPFARPGSGAKETEPDPNAPPRMERLDPSERVRADVAKFQRETLDPSMAPALASDEWDAFVQNMFKLRGWRRGAEGREHIDAVREVEEAYAAYVANREEMRARRAAEEEAAKGKEAAKDEVA